MIKKFNVTWNLEECADSGCELSDLPSVVELDSDDCDFDDDDQIYEAILNMWGVAPESWEIVKKTKKTKPVKKTMTLDQHINNAKEYYKDVISSLEKNGFKCGKPCYYDFEDGDIDLLLEYKKGKYFVDFYYDWTDGKLNRDTINLYSVGYYNYDKDGYNNDLVIEWTTKPTRKSKPSINLDFSTEEFQKASMKIINTCNNVFGTKFNVAVNY